MKHKKYIWVLFCILGALCAFTLMLWPVLAETLAPSYVHTYPVDIPVTGDLSQPAEAEPALRRIIEGLADKTENVVLRDAAYDVDASGVGTAYFAFDFDAPGTAYSHLWERLTSKELTGTLELWVSLPDSTLYQVNHIYGYTKQGAETTV